MECHIIINEVRLTPSTREPFVYPYREVLCVRDFESGVLSLPITNPAKLKELTDLGDSLSSSQRNEKELLQTANDVLEWVDKLKMIKEDTRYIDVEDSYRMPVHIYRKKETSILMEDDIQQSSRLFFITTSEIYHYPHFCGIPIDPNVYNFLFTRFDGDGSKPLLGYVLKTSSSYFELPYVVFHGTDSRFVEGETGILKTGLRPTITNGMFGNGAYYFGDFWKAVRYSFRDSQYTMPSSRASSLPEHLMLHPDSPTGEDKIEVIRKAPAILRYIVFGKNIIHIPEIFHGDIPTIKTFKAHDSFTIKDPEPKYTKTGKLLYDETTASRKEYLQLVWRKKLDYNGFVVVNGKSTDSELVTYDEMKRRYIDDSWLTSTGGDSTLYGETPTNGWDTIYCKGFSFKYKIVDRTTGESKVAYSGITKNLEVACKYKEQFKLLSYHMVDPLTAPLHHNPSYVKSRIL